MYDRYDWTYFANLNKTQQPKDYNNWRRKVLKPKFINKTKPVRGSLSRVAHRSSRCFVWSTLGVQNLHCPDRVLTLYKNNFCEITQCLFETFGRERSGVIEQEPFLLRWEHILVRLVLWSQSCTVELRVFLSHWAQSGLKNLEERKAWWREIHEDWGAVPRGCGLPVEPGPRAQTPKDLPRFYKDECIQNWWTFQLHTLEDRTSCSFKFFTCALSIPATFHWGICAFFCRAERAVEIRTFINNFLWQEKSRWKLIIDSSAQSITTQISFSGCSTTWQCMLLMLLWWAQMFHQRFQMSCAKHKAKTTHLHSQNVHTPCTSTTSTGPGPSPEKMRQRSVSSWNHGTAFLLSRKFLWHFFLTRNESSSTPKTPVPASRLPSNCSIFGTGKLLSWLLQSSFKCFIGASVVKLWCFPKAPGNVIFLFLQSPVLVCKWVPYCCTETYSYLHKQHLVVCLWKREHLNALVLGAEQNFTVWQSFESKIYPPYMTTFMHGRQVCCRTDAKPFPQSYFIVCMFADADAQTLYVTLMILNPRTKRWNGFSEQCSVSALWKTKRNILSESGLHSQTLHNPTDRQLKNGICIQMAEANDELLVTILASWDAKNTFYVQRSFFFPNKEFFASNFFREEWQKLARGWRGISSNDKCVTCTDTRFWESTCTFSIIAHHLGHISIPCLITWLHTGYWRHFDKVGGKSFSPSFLYICLALWMYFDIISW